MISIALVALGSALGGVARYLAGGWIQSHGGPGFPTGTLFVNVAGCLLLGFVTRWLVGVPGSAPWRTLLAIGFCGAFTTFSTFSFELVQLLRDREWPAASAYLAGSIVFGVGALLLGFAAADLLFRVRG